MASMFDFSSVLRNFLQKQGQQGQMGQMGQQALPGPAPGQPGEGQPGEQEPDGDMDDGSGLGGRIDYPETSSPVPGSPGLMMSTTNGPAPRKINRSPFGSFVDKERKLY